MRSGATNGGRLLSARGTCEDLPEMVGFSTKQPFSVRWRRSRVTQPVSLAPCRATGRNRWATPHSALHGAVLLHVLIQACNNTSEAASPVSTPDGLLMVSSLCMTTSLVIFFRREMRGGFEIPPLRLRSRSAPTWHSDSHVREDMLVPCLYLVLYSAPRLCPL